MKCISIILILSFSYYCIGCFSYKTKIVKNEEEFGDSLENDGEIYVKTNNRTTYFYDSNMYKFENDTLYGEGQRITEQDRKNDPEYIKIPYSDIEQIKFKELDSVRTSIFTLIGVGIVVAIVISMSSNFKLFASGTSFSSR